jgi:hypothetical protein
MLHNYDLLHLNSKKTDMCRKGVELVMLPKLAWGEIPQTPRNSATIMECCYLIVSGCTNKI